MVEECRCQEVPRGDLGISRESGVGRHQAHRIDGPPASRVPSEDHRETAGKNAELPPQQGPGKCEAFPSAEHSAGAFGPSNGSDRIGGSWLAHGPLRTVVSRSGGGDKRADESPSRRRDPGALVTISVSPIGATRASVPTHDPVLLPLAAINPTTYGLEMADDH